MKNPVKILRKRWNAYLERLARVNQELYGNRRLDCCDMNGKTDNPRHS